MPSLKQFDARFDLRYVAESTIALLIKHKDVSPQAADLSDTLPSLYYSLSRVYLRDVFISDPEIASNSKYIRDQFEKHSLLWHHGWTSPSECCINGPAWPENTCRTAIRELEYQRAREASASIDDVSFLYFALQRMTDPFSLCHASPGEGQEEEQRIIDSKKVTMREEREFLRDAFYSQSWIAVEHNKGVKWLRRVDCIWALHHNHTGKVDLSLRYNNMFNFFRNIINVETGPREVYEVSPIPPDPALLRRQRAALVDVDGTILANLPSDPHEAFTLAYFPVYTTASRVELMPTDDYFLIADDLVLEIMFRDQVPMLVPSKMGRLETEFEWLEMTDKYISNNVIERLVWPTGAKQMKLSWNIAEKAEAIVRLVSLSSYWPMPNLPASIAAQFKSPHAGNALDRRELLKILKEGEMFAVEGAELMAGLFTTASGSYSMGPCFNNDHGFVAPSNRLPVSVSITDSGMTLDKLVVHISADGGDIRRAYGDGLPIRLLHWLMVNPETMRLNQKLSGRAETILRSVLCTPPDLVNAVLEEKKIKLVRDLDLPTGLMSEESESKATPTNASNTISMAPDSSTPADSPSGQHPHQHCPEVTPAAPKTGPIETPVTRAASSEQFHMEFKPSTATTTQRRCLVPKSRRSMPQSPEEAVPGSPISSDTSTVDALTRRLELLRISDTGSGAPKLCSGFSSREISQRSRFRPFSASQSDISTSWRVLVGVSNDAILKHGIDTPLESDPPLIDKDDPERLSPAALRLADDQPHEFLTYLRRVWNKNRHQIRQSTKLLHDLKQLKVSCHDGNLHSLSKAWYPSQPLVSICSSFLLPEERFRFIILNDQKPSHEDPYPWNFLTEIGCQYEAGDQFLTDLLLTIKKAWPVNVKDPERVSRIYGFFLLRQDHKKSFPDGTYYRPLPDDENCDNFNTHELLLFNGKWIKPSSCFHHAPDYVQSNRVLTPVPAGTDPSSFEPLWICQFYHLVLRIPDFPKTWTAIINGLRALQSSTGQPSIQHVVELYRALNELQLSESERITIRDQFLQHRLIAVEQGGVVEWQNHIECIWSPLKEIRNLTELSRLHPDLKEFFVGLIGVEEATEKIMSLMTNT
ncbi:hypothetical protein FCIRC_3064 [Fusarium circinatum]|uniref:Uncharacterized protein n=1 Tax=Fusarium circinatum TaxID=48490 RepID=A0A8H5X7B1_FUSCI|nr:hypothetical protein FCIRC_3064 [Fusarium circinatum]